MKCSYFSCVTTSRTKHIYQKCRKCLRKLTTYIPPSKLISVGFSTGSWCPTPICPSWLFPQPVNFPDFSRQSVWALPHTICNITRKMNSHRILNKSAVFMPQISAFVAVTHGINCLRSSRQSLASAREPKLTTTSMYIASARGESQLAVGSSGLNVGWA